MKNSVGEWEIFGEMIARMLVAKMIPCTGIYRFMHVHVNLFQYHELGVTGTMQIPAEGNSELLSQIWRSLTGRP